MSSLSLPYLNKSHGYSSPQPLSPPSHKVMKADCGFFVGNVFHSAREMITSMPVLNIMASASVDHQSTGLNYPSQAVHSLALETNPRLVGEMISSQYIKILHSQSLMTRQFRTINMQVATQVRQHCSIPCCGIMYWLGTQTQNFTFSYQMDYYFQFYTSANHILVNRDYEWSIFGVETRPGQLIRVDHRELSLRMQERRILIRRC